MDIHFSLDVALLRIKCKVGRRQVFLIKFFYQRSCREAPINVFYVWWQGYTTSLCGPDGNYKWSFQFVYVASFRLSISVRVVIVTRTSTSNTEHNEGSYEK